MYGVHTSIRLYGLTFTHKRTGMKLGKFCMKIWQIKKKKTTNRSKYRYCYFSDNKANLRQHEHEAGDFEIGIFYETLTLVNFV
jgi:hypothetical protein